MRTVLVHENVVQAFLKMLGRENDPKPMLPKRLVDTYAIWKFHRDRMGGGYQIPSFETLCTIALQSGVIKSLPEDVEPNVDGVEIEKPKVGRPAGSPNKGSNGRTESQSEAG